MATVSARCGMICHTFVEVAAPQITCPADMIFEADGDCQGYGDCACTSVCVMDAGGEDSGLLGFVGAFGYAAPPSQIVFDLDFTDLGERLVYDLPFEAHDALQQMRADLDDLRQNAAEAAPSFDPGDLVPAFTSSL